MSLKAVILSILCCLGIPPSQPQELQKDKQKVAQAFQQAEARFRETLEEKLGKGILEELENGTIEIEED